MSTLTSHRKRQLEEKKLRVPSYDEQGLVFASGHRTTIDAQNVVNRYYKPLLKRACLPRAASTTSGIAACRCWPSAASP